MRRSSVVALCAAACFVFVSAACSSRPPPASQAIASTPPAASPSALPQTGPTSAPSVEPSLEPEVSTAPTPTLDPLMPAFAAFDAARFTHSTLIDNEWMPLRPGARWIIDGVTIEGEERIPHRITFTVTDLTKIIGGVETVVVWIEDFSDGQLVEKEIAFYAQDDDGTVWYLGEHPEEFEDGEFVAAPTWVHGVDDAHAGIKMLRDPLNQTQTFYQGWGPAVEWSDYGRLDEAGISDCVTFGCFEGTVRFAESSLGEAGIYQLKSYAKGIGEIRVGWRGEAESMEDLQLKSKATFKGPKLADIRRLAIELEKHAYKVSAETYGDTEPMK
jgi:hypothetical protein